jgi:predicted kinase
MLGVPGSGKTYFSKKLAVELNAEYINADRIRYDLFGSINAGRTPENHRKTYELVNKKTIEALQSCRSVVRDNQNNSKSDRIWCKEQANKVLSKTIVIWIKTPKELAIKRGISRKGSNSQIKLSPQMASEFHRRSLAALEPPTGDEECIEIDGTLPFNQQFVEFRNKLNTRV